MMMKGDSRLFDPHARLKTPRHRRTYAVFEVWYTAVDVLAALGFLGGSFITLAGGTASLAAICYIAGSLFFLAKPLIRLTREARFLALGRTDVLIERARDP
jgi:hypothetical protein